MTYRTYEKIFDAMPQGVFVFDDKLRVRFTNAAFRRAFSDTASKKGKNEYDEKKLSSVAGAGLSVMTVSVFIMAMWKEALPSVFICIFQAIAVIDCVVMIVLMNTVCKR